jgi:hypothetical protein
MTASLVSHGWSANVSDTAAIHASRVGHDEQPAEGQAVPTAIDLEALGTCAGGYECECLIHTLERDQRVRNGMQSRRQPWQAAAIEPERPA